MSSCCTRISLRIHHNGKNTFVGVGKESNLASVEYPTRQPMHHQHPKNALTCYVLVATQLISWLSSGFHRGCSELIIESTDTSFILCRVIEAGSDYALNDYHKGNLFCL